MQRCGLAQYIKMDLGWIDMDWDSLALAAPHRKSVKHITLAIGTLMEHSGIWILYNIKGENEGVHARSDWQKVRGILGKEAVDGARL